MGLFRKDKAKAPQKAGKERTIADCERMIEGFFKQIGMEPSQHRLPGQGSKGWWIVRGSALIYITLFEHENLTTLRVISPIVFLPENRIVALYRKCLEINMELLNCALAAYQDCVAVVSERPISGLDTIEFTGTLDYLSAVADDLDDKLANEFGAKMYGSAKPAS